ncbi:MAG TPA: radical SAM protein [Elusimicrobiales bacterium]|nr:radical SAM protein [Elusimicrobiales bacterium]
MILPSKKHTRPIGLRKIFFTEIQIHPLVRFCGGARAAKLLADGQWRKLLNYLFSEAARWLGLRTFPAKPYFLSLEPTDNCQLSCPFCVTRCGTGEKHTLPYADYQSLLRFLGPHLIRAELYKGGEPFLHPRIVDMIRLAKSYGAEVHISSNLNNLPPEGAAGLVDSGLDVLVASIDGASQQTYEKYRIGGNFARALENAAAIVEQKHKRGTMFPELIWQFIVFKHNQHELNDAVEMARKAGFDQIMFRPASMPNDPQLHRDWRSTLPEFYEEKLCSEDATCPWPWGGLNVYADGSVSLCYVDGEKHQHISDMPRMAAEMRSGRVYKEARRLICELEKGRAPEPGCAHPCAHCPSFGKSNFWV